MARESRLEIAFIARGRRSPKPLRAAVLALEGAAAADLRTARALAARFDPGALLVAVDGGLATCRAIRSVPDLFVGDLDSTPESPRGISSRIYPVAKDFSDFSGALDEVSGLGPGVVVIPGRLGGRLAHGGANRL